jgi:hypothetical protein
MKRKYTNLKSLFAIVAEYIVKILIRFNREGPLDLKKEMS